MNSQQQDEDPTGPNAGQPGALSPAEEARRDAADQLAPLSMGQSRYRLQPSPTDVIQALHRTPHRYLGLRASVADPKQTAVFPIENRNFQSLDNAISQAMEWWPGETDWTVSGANLLWPQVHVNAEMLPGGTVMQKAPQDLFSFSADTMKP